MENQPTKLDKAIKISIVAGVVVAALSAGYYFGIFLPREAGVKGSKDTTQATSDKMEAEKQALSNFYDRILTAVDNYDFDEAYELTVPQSLKAYLTKDQYTAYQQETEKNQKPFSSKTTINSIEVIGNKGFVDRTIIYCVIEECSGQNRIEDSQKKEFNLRFKN